MNVVYFAERAGRVKIGTTGDLKCRMRELGATFLAAEPGSFKDERAMHQRFASDRIEGEWFSPSPALLAYIASVPPLVQPERPAGQYLRTEAVARRFRVSQATVSRWARTGRLPSFRTPGGQFRFDRAQIDALLTQEGAA